MLVNLLLTVLLNAINKLCPPGSVHFHRAAMISVSIAHSLAPMQGALRENRYASHAC